MIYDADTAQLWDYEVKPADMIQYWNSAGEPLQDISSWELMPATDINTVSLKKNSWKEAQKENCCAKTEVKKNINYRVVKQTTWQLVSDDSHRTTYPKVEVVEYANSIPVLEVGGNKIPLAIIFTHQHEIFKYLIESLTKEGYSNTELEDFEKKFNLMVSTLKYEFNN